VEEMSGNKINITPAREESFHDDRASLPSQKKTFDEEGNVLISPRSSSLWF